MSFHRTLTMSAMLVLTAGTAFAHSGHPGGEDSVLGFAGGFAHPFGGLDHLLAMVAVGLWAIQHGGRAQWLLPLSFVLPMAGGFVLALNGMALPGVEAGIALSVLVLGLVVAFAVRPPLAAAMTITAVFALLHGHAHGTEMGDGSQAMLYAGGMVLATALLHAGGLVAARLAQQLALPALTRAAGAAVALAGIVILVG